MATYFRVVSPPKNPSGAVSSRRLITLIASKSEANKPRHFKVMIKGEGLGEVLGCHHAKRDGIGHGELLIGKTIY